MVEEKKAENWRKHKETQNRRQNIRDGRERGGEAERLDLYDYSGRRSHGSGGLSALSGRTPALLPGLLRMTLLQNVTYTGVLTVLTLTSLSSGVYVRRGSDITDCGLKCAHIEGYLELCRECGGDERSRLLDLSCDDLIYTNNYKSRLHLNTSCGCWTLTDAGKGDSCLYNVVYYGNGSRILRTFPITVLDPVLIFGITSTGSRLGQDIAVSVQFSGEEAAVTWEVDGRPLPDRYRLIDDNRTLIIPRAQRDDAGRRLRVRITNPVSEETREQQLEITGLRSRWILALGPIGLVIVSAGIFLNEKERSVQSCGDEEDGVRGCGDDEYVRPPRSGSEPDPPDVTTELPDPPDVTTELLDCSLQDSWDPHRINGSGIPTG